MRRLSLMGQKRDLWSRRTNVWRLQSCWCYCCVSKLLLLIHVHLSRPSSGCRSAAGDVPTVILNEFATPFDKVSSNWFFLSVGAVVSASKSRFLTARHCHTLAVAIVSSGPLVLLAQSVLHQIGILLKYNLRRSSQYVCILQASIKGRLNSDPACVLCLTVMDAECCKTLINIEHNIIWNQGRS